jgi:hypothetical protein
MISPLKSLAGWSMRFLLILSLAVLAPAQLQAAELKLEIKLIWGTNDKTSPDPTHKPVDAVTAGKLRKVFTWTNYFEVKRVTGTVPSRGTNRFEMSKKCAIEITELEGPKVEVTLIGEGKRVNKTTRHLTKGECFTLGGEDKNGSAWFVMVTELDEK